MQTEKARDGNCSPSEEKKNISWSLLSALEGSVEGELGYPAIFPSASKVVKSIHGNEQ